MAAGPVKGAGVEHPSLADLFPAGHVSVAVADELVLFFANGLLQHPAVVAVEEGDLDAL